MMAKKVPSWMENLKNAMEVGEVKIYACSMTMELFDMKVSDLEPIVADVTGVATFVIGYTVFFTTETVDTEKKIISSLEGKRFSMTCWYWCLLIREPG